MNSIYNHGLKQTQTITKDLTQFEKNLSTSPLSLQGAITTSLTAFRKTIKEYSDLLEKNVNDTSYTKHENRLNKFNQDLNEFTLKFDTLKKQRDIQVQEANKQELLGRRHISTAATAALGSTSSDNPISSSKIQIYPNYYHHHQRHHQRHHQQYFKKRR